ncbi:MAG: IS3 family transposase [Myxococcales bacterium]|nr:IS3 family transposase [Myxococcales bacterium]
MQRVRTQQQVSQRRACRALGFSRAGVRYRSRRRTDQRLRGLLRTLAEQRPRYGYRRLHALLRRRGERVNKKRMHRLYREEGLHLRRQKRRKKRCGPRSVLLPCSRPNQRWSLDFMQDSLGNGRHLLVESRCCQRRHVVEEVTFPERLGRWVRTEAVPVIMRRRLAATSLSLDDERTHPPSTTGANRSSRAQHNTLLDLTISVHRHRLWGQVARGCWWLLVEPGRGFVVLRPRDVVAVPAMSIRSVTSSAPSRLVGLVGYGLLSDLRRRRAAFADTKGIARWLRKGG